MAEGTEQFDLRSLDQMAVRLLAASGRATIWLFHGDPGAGKTTLIRSVVTALGVDAARVSSPTFSILNIYEGDRKSVV